jgi:hypothetical protein
MGTLVFQATLGGQVNLTGPNTASTFTISVPAVTGNMITSGDTATVTSTMISGPVTTAKGGTGLTSFTANGVVYASSTSALATGSALTFDGTNFGVGTSSPIGKLNISNGGASGFEFFTTYLGGGLGTYVQSYNRSTSAYMDTAYNAAMHAFFTSGSEQMRLTSTGLGIGVTSPKKKLTVSESSSSSTTPGTNPVIWVGGGNVTANTLSEIGFTYGSTSWSESNVPATVGFQLTSTVGFGKGALTFCTRDVTTDTAPTERMRLDSAGNLGLGVTPSAYSSGRKAFEIGSVGNGIHAGSGGNTQLDLVTGAYYNTGWKYAATNAGAISRFSMNDVAYGQVEWYIAPQGTAGNAITFTQAATLTAGGNYLLGTTSDYLASRLLVKTTTTDSSTNALTLQNSAATDLLRVRSDGYTYAGFYAQTTAGVANVSISSGGDLLRSISALKYKQDVRDLESIDISKFRAVRYKSKCNGDDQTLDHFGFIADEVHAAGVKELVIYGENNEVEGFRYDRLTSVLLKALQEQQAIITALTARVAALESN